MLMSVSSSYTPSMVYANSDNRTSTHHPAFVQEAQDFMQNSVWPENSPFCIKDGMKGQQYVFIKNKEILVYADGAKVELSKAYLDGHYFPAEDVVRTMPRLVCIGAGLYAKETEAMDTLKHKPLVEVMVWSLYPDCSKSTIDNVVAFYKGGVANYQRLHGGNSGLKVNVVEYETEPVLFENPETPPCLTLGQIIDNAILKMYG